jgi:translation initiation factor 4E
MLRLRKGIVDRYWEDLVLAVIGEQVRDHTCLIHVLYDGVLGQFADSDQVCGVVLTIRPYEDIVSLWTAAAQDDDAVLRIR